MPQSGLCQGFVLCRWTARRLLVFTNSFYDLILSGVVSLRRCSLKRLATHALSQRGLLSDRTCFRIMKYWCLGRNDPEGYNLNN